LVSGGIAFAALAGCATVSNTLSPAEITSLKLTSVKVAVAPETRVRWKDGTNA
jgi:hypothetical protein